MAQETCSILHLALLPWLAFGHLIPFLQLAIALAKAGHRVSFLSTPRNIDRLPKVVPDSLLSLVTFVPIPLPRVEGLPEPAESTDELSWEQAGLLKAAYDLLKDPIMGFLSKSSPDWIIYDFSAYWAGAIAREYGIRSVSFSSFPASAMAFSGPLDRWTEEARRQCWPAPVSLTVKPEWIPFPSTVAFKRHEAELVHPMFYGSNASGTSDIDRVRLGVEACDVVAVRSCYEYEGEYLNLLAKFCRKPVIPVGLLPPVVDSGKGRRTICRSAEDCWSSTFKWLDEEEPRSVVYVSFGSEYKLSQAEVSELALGLQQSNLPFLWALRRPSWLSGDIDEALPAGFVDRTRGRGVVALGWAPQSEILSHPAIGGSLFHCGYGSIVETLGHGLVLILLPFIFDQGLNARFLVEKGVGVEVERSNEDGSFDRDEIARCLRTAMVSDEGEALRNKAREMGAIFGDQRLHDEYVKRFAEYLQNARHE